MRTTHLTLVLAAAALLGACGGKRLAQPPAGLDLGGTWRYNADASDTTPSFAGDTARRGMAGQPGGGGSYPGRGGGRGGGMRGGAGSGMSPRTRAMPLELLSAVPLFTIAQSDSAVRFRFGSKNSVLVLTSGKKVTAAAWPPGGELEVSARWSEEGLRLQRTLPGRGSIVEVLSRSPGSDRLIITTELDTPAGKRTLRRVYDRVEPGGGGS